MVQFSSVAQLCLTLCNPMERSMPGFPVLHQLLELAQTYIHWVDDAIQPSHPVVSFSFCLPSFPASGYFPRSQCFATCGQSIGASASPLVFPMNIQDRFPLGLTGWICLLSEELKKLLQHYSLKTSILWHSAFFIVQLSHSYMTTGKTIGLTRWTFVGKVLSLFFNMLPSLGISFLPRSKHHLSSWLQSPSAVILEFPKINSATVSIVSPSICHVVMGPDAMILVFWMLSFKTTFYSPLSLSSIGSLVPLHFLP